MICDECREEIVGTVITAKSGEKWCYACAKREVGKPENPTRTRTNDQFVLVARLLHDAGGTGSRMGEVIMKARSNRAYTNGHVLMAELYKTPRYPKLVNVDTLWPTDSVTFPQIARVIDDACTGGFPTNIPEEFYRYLKVFMTPTPKNGNIRVKIRATEIVVEDRRDETVMTYGIDAPEGIAPADFDGRYLMALRPKQILTNSTKACAVFHSYDKAVEACKSVLIMPLGAQP